MSKAQDILEQRRQMGYGTIFVTDQDRAIIASIKAEALTMTEAERTSAVAKMLRDFASGKKVFGLWGSALAELIDTIEAI